MKSSDFATNNVKRAFALVMAIALTLIVVCWVGAPVARAGGDVAFAKVKTPNFTFVSPIWVNLG